jgi:antirestriction protein ArdC
VIEVLSNDKRCVVQAASYAQKAIDFLHAPQPQALAEAGAAA